MKNCKKALSILLCLLMLVSLLPGSVLAIEPEEAEPESEEALVEDEPTQAPEYLGTESVAINSTNFPDDNFRIFVKNNCDSDGDNSLSAAEIAEVTEIRCSSKSIAMLNGIEYFTALTKLVCDNNQLTGLDLSSNTALLSLNCSSNKLTSLNVTMNTVLYRLECDANNLTTLDVSKNADLRYLSCFSNQLTGLDISKNTALTDLYCSGNQLTRLDLSKNTALSLIHCNDNRLTTLDIFNTAIFSADRESIFGYQQNALTISVRMLLEQLEVYNANYASEPSNVRVNAQRVSAKSISSNIFPDTAFLNYVKNNFDTNSDNILSVDELAAVTQIDCRSSSIASLEGVEHFFNLAHLNCSSNSLTSLDVSQNPGLTELYCADNQLTGLDISTNSILTDLDCSNNCLSWLDISTAKVCITGNTANLGQQYNRTINVTMTGDQKAIFMESYAGLTRNAGVTVKLIAGVEINSTNFPDHNFRYYVWNNYDANGDNMLSAAEIAAVKEMDCSNESIASLKGIEYLTALNKLSCNNNRLTSLDISMNTKLTYLTCNGNKLTALDVSKNTSLITLYCSNNQLTNLDVTKNTALEFLNCSNNRLITLNLTRNTALDTINCGGQSHTVIACEFTGSDSGYSISISGVSKQFSAIPESFTIDLPITGLEGSLNVTVTVLSSIPIDDAHFPDELFALHLCETADANNDNVLSAEEIYNLRTLDLSKAEDIESLQGIEYLIFLWELDCSGNKLTSLDLSSNRRLNTLNCSNNQLTALDLSNLKSLQQVNCRGNQLTQLNLYQDTFLLNLNCRENLLTSLDVSSCVNLNELDCDSNWLETLDVSANTALEFLYTGNNDLTSLTLGSKPSLMILDCQTNYLDSLDLSGLTGLCALRCDCNGLSSLDVSACSLLEELQCDSQMVFISSDQVTKTSSGYSVTVGGVTKNFTEFPECFTVMVSVTGFDAEMDVYCEVTISLTGDMNGDGSVDLTDVSLLFGMITGRTEKCGDYILRGDKNHDDKVNLRDVNLLFKAAMGT